MTPCVFLEDDNQCKEKKAADSQSPHQRFKRLKMSALANEDCVQSKIQQLESHILESRRHYNHIATLVNLATCNKRDDCKWRYANLALCRVFSKLIATESMRKRKAASDDESMVVDWLNKRYQEYQNALLGSLISGEYEVQTASVKLLMQLIKVELEDSIMERDQVWKQGLFSRLLLTLTNAAIDEQIRAGFINDYVQLYDDIKYYTIWGLSGFASAVNTASSLDHVISILACIEICADSKVKAESLFASSPTQKHQKLFTSKVQQKQAQAAWMAIFKHHLSKEQRKTLLGLLTQRIAPSYMKVELLMDFLTDSFNVGGSTSLMALSGLFQLMQERNLDYPQFYQKLYSLLDSSILYSKHRSRFFRLLDTFLASTHLPAALVASFIKRLSRLCMHSPPSGIVVTVPWIYNLLKNHPTCTFMIHREISKDGKNVELETREMKDPFDMEESDPMSTKAIDSSLWEIETLQSHFHPHVSTISKVISKQFTKQAYNIEDFLDHSYGSMLDAELSKPVKKPPFVEHEVPKRIFLQEDKEVLLQNSLVVRLWGFRS